MSGLNEYGRFDKVLEDYSHLFSENQMRWIIANKERYKIDHAIKRVGRRLYIHLPSFKMWVDEQNA